MLASACCCTLLPPAARFCLPLRDRFCLPPAAARRRSGAPAPILSSVPLSPLPLSWQTGAAQRILQTLDRMLLDEHSAEEEVCGCVIRTVAVPPDKQQSRKRKLEWTASLAREDGSRHKVKSRSSLEALLFHGPAPAAVASPPSLEDGTQTLTAGSALQRLMAYRQLLRRHQDACLRRGVRASDLAVPLFVYAVLDCWVRGEAAPPPADGRGPADSLSLSVRRAPGGELRAAAAIACAGDAAVLVALAAPDGATARRVLGGAVSAPMDRCGEVLVGSEGVVGNSLAAHRAAMANVGFRGGVLCPPQRTRELRKEDVKPGQAVVLGAWRRARLVAKTPVGHGPFDWTLETFDGGPPTSHILFGKGALSGVEVDEDAAAEPVEAAAAPRASRSRRASNSP